MSQAILVIAVSGQVSLTLGERRRKMVGGWTDGGHGRLDEYVAQAKGNSPREPGVWSPMIVESGGLTVDGDIGKRMRPCVGRSIRNDTSKHCHFRCG